MKIASTALLLICFAVTTAQGQDWLGLYADPDGIDNEIVVLPGIPVEAYFVIHVPSFPDGITAIAFGIQEWPASNPNGHILLDWPDAITSGTIRTGIMVAPIGDAHPWLPDENDNILIGIVTFHSFDASWPGDNLHIQVGGDPHQQWPDQPVIVDIDYQAHPIDGDYFWINRLQTAVNSTTFSSLKALY